MDLSDLSAHLGEELPGTTAADFWVALPDTGAIRAADQALIGEARRLADGLGCYVHAVIPAAESAPAAIAAGADRVHVTADAADFLQTQQPEFILLPAAQGALAAKLAQKLGAGLITNALPGSLSVDPETRALLGAHPVYGGDYALDLSVTSATKMATLDGARLPAAALDAGRSGEVEISDLPAPEAHWQDLGPADYQPPAWRPLTKARRIVSVGRGLRDEAGLALARQLAQALGAELAGDRSARDLGWVDEAHEVGVTGQEVAPEIYLALGIAGDTIHNAAIAGARCVMAIQANPLAPIFKVADLGLAAEPQAVLPLLLAAIEKQKESEP